MLSFQSVSQQRSESYIQLNQYRLMEEIGQVSWSLFYGGWAVLSVSHESLSCQPDKAVSTQIPIKNRWIGWQPISETLVQFVSANFWSSGNYGISSIFQGRRKQSNSENKSESMFLLSLKPL